jgi:hypothetical protein
MKGREKVLWWKRIVVFFTLPLSSLNVKILYFDIM